MRGAAQSSTKRDIVSAAIDGASYEIDLSEANATKLRAALTEYVRTQRIGAPVTRERTTSFENWLTDFDARLQENLQQLAQHDPAIVDIDPVELADNLVAAVPTRHDLDALTGPFYDTPGLTKWLKVTRQALDARAKKYTLLMCPLADGTRVYPAWQFRSDGTTVPHLAKTLGILLPAAKSPWTVATWLRTKLSEFDDEDAITWLDTGRSPERVFTAAREDADRWAR